MKFVIVFAALFAAAMAFPGYETDETVRSSFDNIGVDGYKFE